MRQHQRKRKLFLLMLVSIPVLGCATPPKAVRNASDLENGSTGRLIVESHGSREENLIESSAPTGGDKFATVGYRLGSASPYAGLEASPQLDDEDLIATEDKSPSDLALPLPVTITDSETENPITADSVAGSPPQSVDDFVTLALAGHPSIHAARLRVAAEINRIPQARALPDPMFNNIFWPIQDQALQTAAGRVGNQMSLTQAVPWPEKLHTKAAIVSQEVQIAQAEVERIEREITESVRLAYYEVWFATRAITIIEATQELVRDLAQVAEARYRSGGTQQDVIRARLESDRLENQLVELNKQKQMAQADLAALVQQPVSLIAETEPELNIDDVPKQLDELIAQAEQCNPKLKGLAWEIQRNRQEQKLACLQRYPDLQVGLHWGLVSDDDNVVSRVANGHDTLSFNVGTTLPIWRDKINSGVREASHRTGSSTQQLEAERDALYGKLRRLLAQADALHEQRQIYTQRIIPRTEDTLKLSIADYRGKRTDFFSLIETYRELLMVETQLARIETTLAGTLAQIDRAVGCPLP